MQTIKVFCRVLLFMLSWLLTLTSAHSFTYVDKMWCGEGQRPALLSVTGVEDYLHYYIHIDEYGQILVHNDGYQYASFDKLRYYQIFVQNAALTHLEILTRSDDTMHLVLKDLESDYTKHLVINFNSMTYISRVVRGEKKYSSQTGTCEFI